MPKSGLSGSVRGAPSNGRPMVLNPGSNSTIIRQISFIYKNS